MRERFFYHSFPRRSALQDPIQKGFRILEAIFESGILLTPEATEWFEFRNDGSKSQGITNFQSRACFTELAPDELGEHAKVFGPFALEFRPDDFRRLGGLPVFYLPPPAEKDEDFSGLGGSLIARLAEIQQLLTQLAEAARVAKATENKWEYLHVQDARGKAMTRCTIGGAEDLIAFVSLGTQSPQELLNALRAISGLFYPTENLNYTKELAYYRQREWRILCQPMRRGIPLSRPINEVEKTRLIALDPDFFNRRIKYPTGEMRRVDECHYVSEASGRRFASWARRIIVPDECKSEVEHLAKLKDVTVPVVGLSDL